jgi:hypothetical protein
MVNRSPATGAHNQGRNEEEEFTYSVSGWPARFRCIPGVLAPSSIMAAAELYDYGC